MVIPPPVSPPRVTEYLKPYVLKMDFTNKYMHAIVIYSPTATVATSSSSQEKALKPNTGTTRDVLDLSLLFALSCGSRRSIRKHTFLSPDAVGKKAKASNDFTWILPEKMLDFLDAPVLYIKLGYSDFKSLTQLN
ncbi:hypothetical protein Dimus_034336 [Dionaea muscipula]